MLQSCGEEKERIHYWYSRGCNSGAKNFAEFRTMRFNSSADGQPEAHFVTSSKRSRRLQPDGITSAQNSHQAAPTMGMGLLEVAPCISMA